MVGLLLATALGGARSLPAPASRDPITPNTAPRRLAAAPTSPATRSAEVALGRRLFEDPGLSRGGAVSCKSCHDPALGFSDGRPVSIGVDGRRGTRNSPSILLAATTPRLFWDGRAGSLEEQALGPIANPVEMDRPVAELVQALAADPSYGPAFRAVYPDGATATNLARAIAAFERTIRPGPSPHDRWLAGDAQALSPAALRGVRVFRRNRCVACHKGPDFTDHAFHNVGWGSDHTSPDAGRFAVTHDPEDQGGFKTPTLRNVAQSAPYFHDGQAATLEAVVDYYDKGGNPNPNLDFRVQPMNLSAEDKADLLAFLRSLSGGHRFGQIDAPPAGKPGPGLRPSAGS